MYFSDSKNKRKAIDRPSDLILRDSIIPDGTDHGYSSKKNISIPPPPLHPFPISPPSTPLVTAEPNVLTEEIVEDMEVEESKSYEELESEITKLQNELLAYKRGLAKILNPDSIEVLIGDKDKQNHWSFKTIEQALHLRYIIGTKGYEELLELGWPFPTIRTLNNRTECMPFQPGINRENMEILRNQAPLMNPKERFAILTFDEMAIQAKIEVDRTSGGIIGFATMPLSTPSQKSKKGMISCD